jgi:DMSO/TMAO reductase YedYZ molybdopterin-dependent catalytic subunit
MHLLPLLFLAGAAFAADPVLRIEGVAGHDGVARPPVQFSLAELQSMPRVALQAKAHDGKDHAFEGVALAELLHRAGLPQGEEPRGPLLSRYLLVTAHDGYRAIFSLPELDPAFSDTRALVADHMDGQPLPSRDGPLRLVLPAEKRETRWVLMLERIEILSAPDPIR